MLRVVINGSMSDWKEVWRWIPKGPFLGLVLFSIFTNDLEDRIEQVRSQFVDKTQLGRAADILEGRIRIQSDLDMLEKWSETNWTTFNEDKCKVWHLGYNS